jgi:RND family efflux transporter MFP subunit
MRAGFAMAAVLALLAQAAIAQETFTVAPKLVADEKAVFATVESANVVPARARIGGTVVELAVKEGDSVKQGQIVATIGDEKLALQMKSLDAQISGLEAQVAQAQNDLTRAEDLFSRGTVPKTTLDQARTAFNVASNALKARTAERSVIQQQVTEGKVLAPASGRVLKVPVTTGTFILPGETVATVAEQNFILRLRVPERHARFLKAGDSVRIDGEELGKELGKEFGKEFGKELRKSGAQFGTIRLVYPQIEDGRVIADAAVAGLGDYFVGERIRVWVSAGERDSIIVPASFIVTRFGIDYARVRKDDKSVIDVPVQRGRELPRPDMPDALEILSGLKSGDVLVRP